MTVASNPDEPVFYVYVLVDPRKGGKFVCGDFVSPYEPFYVGKGKGARYKSHSLRSSNLVKNKIAAIKRKTGKLHKVKILRRDLTETQAYKIEARLIKSIGLKIKEEGPLLNMNEGGSGIQQGYVSEETRLRRSKSLKDYWAKSKANKKAYEKRTQNMGRNWTDEQREETSKRKADFYASKQGIKTRKLLAKRAASIARARTPKEVKKIYDKQKATRKANKERRKTTKP